MSEQIELPLFFLGAEDTPIVFANLLVVQHQNKEFILTFAQYSPPLLMGSDEERVTQAKNMPYVPVKVIARIGMTPERMKEVIDTLTLNYKKFERRSDD